MFRVARRCVALALSLFASVAFGAAPSLTMEFGTASVTYDFGADAPNVHDFDANGGMVSGFYTVITRNERNGARRWRIDLHDIPAPGANAFPSVVQLTLVSAGRVMVLATGFSTTSTNVLAPDSWAPTHFSGNPSAIVWLDDANGSLTPGTAVPGNPKGLAVASDGTAYYSYIDFASNSCRLSRFSGDLKVRLSDRAIPLPNEDCGRIAADASSPDRFIGFGRTADANFVTSDGRGLLGVADGLLVRGTADGSAADWTGRIGGSGDENVASVVSTAGGDLYACGTVQQGDLNGTAGSYRAVRNGEWDAWVAKLAPSGNIDWLTFLGGSSLDGCLALARSTSGRLFVGGATFSIDLPTTASSMTQHSKVVDGYDGFLIELSGDGTNCIYATYLGGGTTNPRGYSAENLIRYMEVVGSDELAIAGGTNATDIPISSDGTSFLPNLGGTFQMRFDHPSVVQTSDPVLPLLWIGSSYSTTLAASGAGPFSFELVFGALPDGLSLAADGTLSGTLSAFPVAEFIDYGIPIFGVEVTDASGNHDIRTYYLPWDSVSAPAISNTSFSGNTTTQPMNLPVVWVFINTDPRAPMQWTLTGNVPPGLSLQLQPDPAEVRLVGAPTTPGTYSFSLNVTDRQGHSASYPLTVTVPNPVPPPAEGGGGGGGSTDLLGLLLLLLLGLVRSATSSAAGTAPALPSCTRRG